MFKGLQYSSALLSAISHLPGRKGLVSGVVICGFGFGGFLWGLLARLFCNPDNLRPQEFPGSPDLLFEESVAKNVPSMIRKLCLVQISLCLFGVATISKAPRENLPERTSETDLCL